MPTISDPPMSQISEKSLQLKPARKDEVIVEQETPYRSEESGGMDDKPSEEARVVFNSPDSTQKETPRDHVDVYDDDLANMILMAKTTEHLVSALFDSPIQDVNRKAAIGL